MNRRTIVSALRLARTALRNKAAHRCSALVFLGALVCSVTALAGPAEDFRKLEDDLVSAHTDYQEALEKLDHDEDGKLKPGVTPPPDPRPGILSQMDALAEKSAGSKDGLPMSMGAFVWSWNFDLDLDRLHARFERLAKHYPDAKEMLDVLPSLPQVAGMLGKTEMWAGSIKKLAEATKDEDVKLAAQYALGEVHLRTDKPADGKPAFEQVIQLAPESDLAKLAKGYIYEIEHLQVGMAAPEFTLTTLNGKEISLKSLRGKIVLLDFWASWCPNCFAELPRLRATIKKFADEPFEVIGVSLDDTREEAESVLKHHDFPAVHSWHEAGPEHPVGVQYNVQELPTWYLIDAGGIIRARDPFGEKLDRTLAALVKASE
jgi:peroxiredoxin